MSSSQTSSSSSSSSSSTSSSSHGEAYNDNTHPPPQRRRRQLRSSSLSSRRLPPAPPAQPTSSNSATAMTITSNSRSNRTKSSTSTATTSTAGMNDDRQGQGQGNGHGRTSRRLNRNGQILSAKFVRTAKNKKELVSRLGQVLNVLRNDDHIHPNNTKDYPGLASLCQTLVSSSSSSSSAGADDHNNYDHFYSGSLLEHRDKEVRLYTVACCMELFTVFVPSPPWNQQETLAIFQQTTRQLANLAHTTLPNVTTLDSNDINTSVTPTTSHGGKKSSSNGSRSTSTHIYTYFRILDVFASVQIGIVLVDLYNVSRDDDENDVHGDTGDGHEIHHRRQQRSNGRSSNGSRGGSGSSKTRTPVSQLTHDDDDEDDQNDFFEGSDDDDDDDIDESSNISRHRQGARGRRSRPRQTSNVRRKDALDAIIELFHTFLNMVRLGHPPEIADNAQKSLVSCVDEFFDNGASVPTPILDELLFCIGQGPQVLVLQQPPPNPTPSSSSSSSPSNNNSDSKKRRRVAPVVAVPPVQVAVRNPSFFVASAVVRRTKERLTHPIATLLSGLVDSNHRQMTQSNVSNLLEDNEDEDLENGTDDVHPGDDTDNDDDDEYQFGSVRPNKRRRGPNSNPSKSLASTTATTTAATKKNKSDTANSSTAVERRREKKLRQLLDVVEKLGLPQLQQQSQDDSTSNVWSIIYQMHRVAPSMLTTVIGHLQHHLDSSKFVTRILVVQTLGKLFVGTCGVSNGTGSVIVDGAVTKKNVGPSGRPSSVCFPIQYASCYRNWLARYFDNHIEVRRIMIPHLMMLAKAAGPLGGGSVKTHTTDPNSEVSREAQDTLKLMLMKEPDPHLRLSVSQGLCDLSIRYRHLLKDDLLLDIGTQINMGGKGRITERRSALTGLVQAYHRQYLNHHLRKVLAGGDDCPIETVLEALHTTCRPVVEESQSALRVRSKSTPIQKSPPARRSKTAQNVEDNEWDTFFTDENDRAEENDADYEYYQWIPTKLFEAANTFTDAEDAETHSRIVALVDDMILGSDMPHLKKKYHLSDTARAVGLAIALNSVQSKSQLAVKAMRRLLKTRAEVQKALKAYLDARGEIRSYPPNSEEAFEADARAMDMLERVAAKIPPPPGALPAAGEWHSALEKFHSIKDKHVFRILGPITNPDHTIKARIRALDELPKRVKATVGDSASIWVKTLSRRCAMGDFMNKVIVEHCTMLAQECFEEDDFHATNYFLNCVDLAARCYPILCAGNDVFMALTSMFETCSDPSYKGKRKKDMQKSGIVTTLSGILAAAAPQRVQGIGTTALRDGSIGNTGRSLEKQLLALIREGTPEEARNSVRALSALLKQPTDSETGLAQDHVDAFQPVLKILASPSRLTVDQSGFPSSLVCILAGLTELTENVPSVLSASSTGMYAVEFALNTVLLGRSRSNGGDREVGSDSDSGEDEDEMDPSASKPTTPRQRRRLTKSTSPKRNLSPAVSKDPVNDTSLSTSCRTLCAAIEFLSTFLRSSILSMKGLDETNIFISSNHQLVEKLFHSLTQIVRDEGTAPSSRDRKACSRLQCRAALRQTSAIWLLRLSETRLSLQSKFLTVERWHILGGSLLDEEASVRETVMAEFVALMTGTGVYNRPDKQSIRWRFLSYLSLCVDDNATKSSANGGAANLGKPCSSAKKNGLEAIVGFRLVYESQIALARAQGDDAELYFERSLKPTLLPEYVLPYVVSILTHRHETPSSDDDQAGLRVLKKRLKNVFEPLIMSLGSNADNISFLLRFCELISARQPVGGEDKEIRKMKIVLNEAREVLLSMVRSDVNLASYPGHVFIPHHLFEATSKKRKQPDEKERETSSSKDTHPEQMKQPKASVASTQSSWDSNGEYSLSTHNSTAESPSKSKGSIQGCDVGSFNSRRRHRSDGISINDPLTPENNFDRVEARPPSMSTSPKGSVRFSLGDDVLSPINAESPADSRSTPFRNPNMDTASPSSEEKTRGTTPPSGLKHFSATASLGMESSVTTNASTSTPAKSPSAMPGDRPRHHHGRRRSSSSSIRSSFSPKNDKENPPSVSKSNRASRSTKNQPPQKKARVLRIKKTSPPSTNSSTSGKAKNMESKKSGSTSRRVLRNRSTKATQPEDDPFEF